MPYQIGDIYRAKTGEILEVQEFKSGKFAFLLRHPETLEPSDSVIEGPLEMLSSWARDVDLKLIDPDTYVPTGLVEIDD